VLYGSAADAVKNAVYVVPSCRSSKNKDTSSVPVALACYRLYAPNNELLASVPLNICALYGVFTPLLVLLLLVPSSPSLATLVKLNCEVSVGAFATPFFESVAVD
jgi:hypothetical protein